MADYPILDDNFGSRLSSRPILGYPCTVTDEGDPSIELGDATGERAMYSPDAEEVDFAWNCAFRRMAEAMASKLGADPFVHTERMPDTELIDGIAIRLRDMGARFPLERDSQGRHRLKLPGNTLNHVTYGTTDDTREPFLYFDAGAGDWEVLLRVNDSATASDRVWYARRPATGPERGKAVGRWKWSALDPTADRRQWRYWPNLV